MKERLNRYGPTTFQLVAAAMLVFASFLTDLVWLFALDLVLAGVVVFCSGYLFGRITTRHAFERSFEWMPRSVHLSESEDGTKVALVEQVSGAVVSIELPDDVDSAEEAMHYVLRSLDPNADA